MSRGGRALDAHVDGADGAPAAERWQPGTSNRLRGQRPLDVITGHVVDHHWHLVTYGLSELESKQSDDAEHSGWGFELTLRVPDPAETPSWGVDLLNNLAAYVWTQGHPFAAGDHLDLRGPIKLGADTAITAAAVVDDPGLGTLDGPFGRVEFLQLVGLTADELEACRAWSTAGVIDLLAADDPWLRTRLGRPSLFDDPAARAQLDQRTAAGGSTFCELCVGTLSVAQHPFGRAVVTMGGGAAAALGPALRRELVAEGASFLLLGDRNQVRFGVSAESAWSLDDGNVSISVTPDEIDALAALFDGRTGWGRRRSLPGLRFHVVA